MESILTHVSAILARHPAPAMPLPELLLRLRADVPGVAPGESALLRALAGDRCRFTIVDAEPGERSLEGVLGASDSAPRPSRRQERGPWVICSEARVAPTLCRSQSLVRETVAHLGHGLDKQSARALARWLSLLRECSRIGERLREGRPRNGRTESGGRRGPCPNQAAGRERKAPHHHSPSRSSASVRRMP